MEEKIEAENGLINSQVYKTLTLQSPKATLQIRHQPHRIQMLADPRASFYKTEDLFLRAR